MLPYGSSFPIYHRLYTSREMLTTVKNHRLHSDRCTMCVPTRRQWTRRSASAARTNRSELAPMANRVAPATTMAVRALVDSAGASNRNHLRV